MGVALGKQEIEEEMSTQNTLQLISTDQINDELSNEFCKRTYLKYFENDNLQYLGDGGYSKVIMTNWTKGPKWSWDEENQQRIRSGPRK
ncbi:5798_t:CDS:2, partial [Entrophospora sp. SA101]